MLDEKTVHELIDSSQVARLAQLDNEQAVHAIPFVFARVGEMLYSPVDGKPKRHAALSRLNWIEKHPQVTVLIDHYEDNWERLWWLRLYGEAVKVNSTDPHWDSATLGLKKKYPQYDRISMFNGEPTMLRINVARWKYWAAQA